MSQQAITNRLETNEKKKEKCQPKKVSTTTTKEDTKKSQIRILELK